jgi:biopolymer transport protein ExbB/TolQ
MEKEKKYLGGWWFWIILLMIISGLILTGLNYAGIIGRTVVEREVFEQSYQRSESLKSEIAAYESQLVEINSQLSRSDLDAGTRANLESQTSSIRVMLNTARRKQ